MEAAAAAGGPKAALARVEQALGVKHDARGPLFARTTHHLLPLERLCFDPMGLVLSRGIAVWQLVGRGLRGYREGRMPQEGASGSWAPDPPPSPGLLEAMRPHGLTPAALDAFCAGWRAPAASSSSGGRPLPAEWFQDRFKTAESSLGPSGPAGVRPRAAGP